MMIGNGQLIVSNGLNGSDEPWEDLSMGVTVDLVPNEFTNYHCSVDRSSKKIAAASPRAAVAIGKLCLVVGFTTSS